MLGGYELKILIDATALNRSVTGIEYYAGEVSRAIYGRSDLVEGCICYYVFLGVAPEWFEELEAHKAIIIRPCARVIVEQFVIPALILKIRPDVAFFPCFPPGFLLSLVKIFVSFKLVKTVFDGVMWRMPNTLSLGNKLYMKPLETFGIRFVYDHIVTISEFSKLEIMEIFSLPSSAVSNCGISYKKRSSETLCSRGTLGWGLERGKYFLYVGTMDPRKNIVFILRVMRILLDRGVNAQLVIAGRSGWGGDEVLAEIRELNLFSHVLLTGYVSDEDLVTLYGDAAAFVFPSKYEGFGLPVIEAIECGCPVIAMNCSAIPEAGGGLALLLNDCIDDWCAAMTNILDDPSIKLNLLATSSGHLNKFCWNNTATLILERLQQ